MKSFILPDCGASDAFVSNPGWVPHFSRSWREVGIFRPGQGSTQQIAGSAHGLNECAGGKISRTDSVHFTLAPMDLQFRSPQRRGREKVRQAAGTLVPPLPLFGCHYDGNNGAFLRDVLWAFRLGALNDFAESCLTLDHCPVGRPHGCSLQSKGHMGIIVVIKCVAEQDNKNFSLEVSVLFFGIRSPFEDRSSDLPTAIPSATNRVTHGIPTSGSP